MNKLRIILLLTDVAGAVFALCCGRWSIYLLTASLTAFTAFALDKYCALAGHRRFPELYLWLITALGGGVGALAAMFICRHKIRKVKFSLVVVILTVIQLLLAGILL